MTVGYTHFMPDNIELRLFKEKVERQYMLKPERTDEKILTLRFNTSLDTIPVPVPLNFTPADSNWYFLQTAEEGKAVDRFFDLEARYAASGGELPEKRFHEYTSSADRYGTIYHASPSCGEEEKEKRR